MRCLLALSLAAHAAAQLVIDPAPQNLEALLDEFKDDEAAENLVLGAGPGLQEPTICDPSVKQHSGLLDAGNGTKYFFWLFESRSSPSTDPLVIWLTGGPGCSSTLALLAENGPCTLDGTGRTTPNPHSWSGRANVLWLDQPQSTGFSTGKLEVSGNEDETVEHFYTFLMNFYKALPQYKKNGLYISGESYGGHWVPAVAHRVWQGGLANAPLKGILIGNGLTNPEEQYNWYWKMAQDGGKTEGGTLKESPVGRLGVGTMRLGSGACVKAIGKCNDVNSSLQGDVDFICNWLGNKHWTLKLDWSHKEDFNAAEEKPYLLADGKTEFGKLRQAHGLAFLQVYQAGHMVPMDKPEAALTMLNDFISEKVAHAPEEVVV